MAIARTLVTEPHFLLLDESTCALYPEMAGEVLDAIREFVDEGMTMMIATHAVGAARVVAIRVVFIDRCEVLEEGTPTGVSDLPRRAHTTVPVECATPKPGNTVGLRHR